MTALDNIKAALEAGPTDGPWSVGPWFDNDGVRELVIERMTDAGNLCVAVALGGLAGQSANAALIAACNPQAMQEIVRLAEIGRRWESDSSLSLWFPMTAERLESLEKDAARYRFLRDNLDSDWAICEWCNKEDAYVRDRRAAHVVDAAIDAAKEQTK